MAKVVTDISRARWAEKSSTIFQRYGRGGVIGLLLCLLPAGWLRGEEWVCVEKSAIPGPVDQVGLAFRNGQVGAKIHAFVFRESEFDLVVVENPNAKDRNMEAALRKAGCIAGVNGGYFHPDFTPSGLVISGGVLRHSFEHAALLSGVVWGKPGQIGLQRRAEFAGGSEIQAALQAGPFLVDRGTPVQGLQDTKLARRTFVATDGQGRYAMGMISSVTLADAGTILSRAPFFADSGVERAINLDGGSSSGIWIETQPKPFRIGPLVPVRNYLGIRPRS
jgi:uncharacterized protein YigE (DUF2233 family)